MYSFFRRIFFWFDAEAVHHFSMILLSLVCRFGFIKKGIACFFSPQKNHTPTLVFGLSFKNPIGLAAGFDKNAKYLKGLQALHFGHVEIGTVTPLPQQGNPKPRLFRLPKDKALINRMGFNNDGMEVVAKRLKQWRQLHAKDRLTTNHHLIVGGNIGKNKNTPNEEAWKDYEKCFVALHPYVDYFVVNVSSPNTPGLRALQEKPALQKILLHLQGLNKLQPYPKPILLKIAPDLGFAEIDDVISLATEIQLDGLVVSNTTISRAELKTTSQKLETIGAGGLSGKPLSKTSTLLVKYIAEKTNGHIPIIASGGVFTKADAAEKMAAGACLVQVWTGFVYQGPGIVKQIVSG